MYQSSYGKLVFFLLVGAYLTACSSQLPAPVEPQIPTQRPVASQPDIATSIAETQNSTEFIEQIRIKYPGSDSRIASPILLELLVPPSSTGLVRIELASPTGALLVRQILRPGAELTEISVPINFESNRTAIEAYLIASTEDEYDRLIALDSAAITLLNEGESVIVANNGSNQIQITSPKAEASLNGGSLTISGAAATQPGRALNIELITREGRVLAFGETYPAFQQGSELGGFSLVLDYQVDEPTWVLIGVAERLSGFIIHYASLEVLLNP
jgi:hypothetical protein